MKRCEVSQTLQLGYLLKTRDIVYLSRPNTTMHTRINASQLNHWLWMAPIPKAATENSNQGRLDPWLGCGFSGSRVIQNSMQWLLRRLLLLLSPSLTYCTFKHWARLFVGRPDGWSLRVSW